ncbi:cell wall hydrolase [Zhaonella formicivorans]|uniref:cell wall hydrolase n=1 Tax=Zhaonella formicivorans TaxID=2528593 RepID=UPI0010E7EFDA
MRKKLPILLLCALLLTPTLAYAGTYYVQKGDSLFTIGQRYGVSAEYVRQTNGLKSVMIYPGQKLWVPDQKVNAYNYTVKKGDTLYNIAKKYGTTPQAIKATTGLKSDYLVPGQALLIPKTSAAKPVTYSTGQQTTKLASRAGSSAELRQETQKNKVSAEEFELLAKIVYGESRGEPFKGQVAVAAVVLNRVKSPKFPNTIKGVIFQPGAFTAVVDGQAYLNPDETAYKAVQAALDGWDPTNGALYYWNPAKTTNKWIWSKPIKMQIGSHVFAD